MIPSNLSRYKYLPFKDQQAYQRYVPAQITSDTPAEKTNGQDLAKIPSHGSYGALLLHPSWKAKRKGILDRDGHKCVHCSSNIELQVHHRQYHFSEGLKKFQLPWEYPDRLLITLCQSCHNKGHNKYKVPIIIIQ